VKPTSWFGIIVLYTILTLLFVYFIPDGSQFSVFTIVFGFFFVAVVPGYSLVSLLFQEGKLDLIEKAVLSVALSFSIAGVGIIVVVLAFLTLLRKRKLQIQRT